MDTRIVKADQVLRDIRRGLTKSELMEKYGLSDSGLQGIVGILVDAEAISRNEIYGELYYQLDDAVTPETARSVNRARLDFDALIYDLRNPETQGRVRDVSEEGVGLAGIEADVDEIKTLVILGDPYGEIEPFEFRARCRWTRKDDGDWMTGFQITDIAEEHRRELQKLIELVASGES